MTLFSPSFSSFLSCPFLVPAHIAHCRAQEIGETDAGDGDRILESEENAQLGALVRLQVENALAIEAGYRRR